MNLEASERKALGSYKAYESFSYRLGVIRFFRNTLEGVIQSLKEEYEKTEREWEDEKNLFDYAPPDYPDMDKQKKALQDTESSLKSITDEIEMWEDELPRQVAIKYCIAFENFLRDFLAERMLARPEKLVSYLVKRVGLSVTILKSPLEQEDVVECISAEYQAFQSLKGLVKTAYQKLLKKDPAGAFEESQSIFEEQEWRKAQADILLLFEIRHHLIHRDGKTGAKYQQKMNEHRWRLNRGFVKRNKGDIPAPAKLVFSPARGSVNDKSYEFEESLRSYACYITQVCG